MLSTVLPAGKGAADVVARPAVYAFTKPPETAPEGEEFICVCTNHYGYTTFRTEASQQNQGDTELRRQSPYQGHAPR